MYWLYFVFLVLGLGAYGTAEESPVGNSEKYTSEADVRNGDRIASSDEPLRQLVESLLERVELMEKTMEENKKDLKRKDIRIRHLERELDEMKAAPYQIQSHVDKRQQSWAQDQDFNPEDQGHDISPEGQDHDTNSDASKNQNKTTRVSSANSGEVGAFSVSLSKGMNLHPGFVLPFDEVPLDVGGNYNKADGVYIVPVSGVYVFTWITTGSTTADLVTELVVNGSPRGIAISDGDSYHWDSTTGLIVTSVSAGDHVFIRSKYSGLLHSANIYTKAMFSGWRLS